MRYQLKRPQIATGQRVEGPTFEIATVPWLSNHTFVQFRLRIVPCLRLLWNPLV